jgi:twitching motility two-component system response regulator PilG
MEQGRPNIVKILLVEDSRTLRLSNERALLKAGYEVICAEDGESALRCAKEQMPDLILLDLLLPRVSGLEVLTRLKHNRANGGDSCGCRQRTLREKPPKAHSGGR